MQEPPIESLSRDEQARCYRRAIAKYDELNSKRPFDPERIGRQAEVCRRLEAILQPCVACGEPDARLFHAYLGGHCWTMDRLCSDRRACEARVFAQTRAAAESCFLCELAILGEPVWIHTMRRGRVAFCRACADDWMAARKAEDEARAQWRAFLAASEAAGLRWEGAPC